MEINSRNTRTQPLAQSKWHDLSVATTKGLGIRLDYLNALNYTLFLFGGEPGINSLQQALSTTTKALQAFTQQQMLRRAIY